MNAGLPIGNYTFNGDRLKVDAAFGVNAASTTNSTTALLGIGASFNGVYEQVLDYSQTSTSISSSGAVAV